MFRGVPVYTNANSKRVCVFYTVRGHHCVASRVSSQTPAQLKSSGRESLYTIVTRARLEAERGTRGVAAGPYAPVLPLWDQTRICRPRYTVGLFSINYKRKKTTRGAWAKGARIRRPHHHPPVLPDRWQRPVFLGGRPQAPARFTPVSGCMANPPGPIFGSGPTRGADGCSRHAPP